MNQDILYTFDTFERVCDKQWEENKKKASELVEGFVKIGYLLKLARDTAILEGSSYCDYLDFAQKKYEIGKDVVSRYININNSFSEGGNSMVLQEKYRGFGYSKLAVMLTIPEEICEEITAEYSKSEIQAIKEEVDAENKITDIEVMLEEQGVNQREMENLQKVLYQMFGDDPKIFSRVYEFCEKETDNKNELYELFAPAGEKMYSVRVSGVGRFFLFVKKEEIVLEDVRKREKERYSWEEFQKHLCFICGYGSSVMEAWEKLYQKPYPKENVPVAPVQLKTERTPRKESRVQKAGRPKMEIKKVQEKKEEEDVKKNEIENYAVLVENKTTAAQLQQRGTASADIKPNEQYCTQQMSRERIQQQLELQKQEIINSLNREMEQLKENIITMQWSGARYKAEQVGVWLKKMEQIERLTIKSQV